MFGIRSVNLAVLLYFINLCRSSAGFYQCNFSEKFHVSNCSQGVNVRYIGLDRVAPTIYLNSSEVMDITPNAFDTVPELQKLYLNDNHLQEIKPQWFSRLTSLSLLDVSRNKIKIYFPGTFQSVRYLQRLYLGHNDLQVFDGKSDNFGRTIIDLSHNPLNEIYIDRVHTLHINHTNVTQLHFTQAVNILAEYAKIESFSSSEGVIDKLHLRGNNIRDLSNLTDSFARMLYLDISENTISAIPADAFRHLKGLRHLNISKVDLYEMYYGMFSSQRALEVLDISYNYLWHLNMNKMYPARLRELYLLGNSVWKVTDSRRSMRSLEKIGIAGNELSCERLFKIYHKAVERGIEFLIPSHMANYTSDNIAGMPCRDVQ